MATRHASEIMEDLGYGRTEATSSPAPSTRTDDGSRAVAGDELDRRVANLFVGMIRIFRQAWISTYGETDDGTWRAVVAQLDRLEVRRGLELCHGHWQGDFPPRPAQFISMARIPAAHRPAPRSRQIGVQAAQDHVRDEHLRKLKELVR
jgi:hypothetical protein